MLQDLIQSTGSIRSTSKCNEQVVIWVGFGFGILRDVWSADGWLRRRIGDDMTV